MFPRPSLTNRFPLFPLLCSLVLSLTVPGTGSAAEDVESATPEAGYTGAAGCRSCHENFYQLWAPSHHGKAMQPYTDEFAAENLTPQDEPITIGEYSYRAAIGKGEGYVAETGPEGQVAYPILHVMGGKNVYYFLTPMERGRLQVLPVAYDVRSSAWYDMPASGIRHFHDRTDEAFFWKDPVYTFNTSCFGCHVSQFSTNYDLATDTYKTTWTEPGINCETCHGPGEEHIRECQEAPEGEPPKDLKIIKVSEFSPDQLNSLCAPCHAKMSPITLSFTPGERYFDHFDLVTLEHPDFYPDGRDLGENYTMTSWIMSPCIKGGDFDCLHCHTSSGRYRFHGEEANKACMPCHAARVANATEHTHHPAGSAGNRCVSCHMPMTSFAAMNRTDHSMRPPTPAATLAFNSPNACMICHDVKDATWADEKVSAWFGDDYEEPVLRIATLVDDARHDRWERLPAMLAYIADPGRDTVFANSLIRLVRRSDREEVWPVLVDVLQKDPSPLLRASAAEALGDNPVPEHIEALAKATQDDFRLVRIRAAATMGAVPLDMLPTDSRGAVIRASQETLDSFTSRPDDYASHYNLGNLMAARGKYPEAILAYRIASRFRPDFVPPLVNIALVYNAQGMNDEAEASLRRALEIDPKSVAANLNLGMLLAEMGREAEAEKAFRTTLRLDADTPQAAFNLGVLLAQGGKVEEGITWCRDAYEARPGSTKYAYTLAFYLQQTGETEEATRILEEAIRPRPAAPEAYGLLARLHVDAGDLDRAVEVCRRAAMNTSLADRDRAYFGRMADEYSRQDGGGAR